MNVEQIYERSMEHKAIFFITYNYVRFYPASWLISMQARTLCDWISKGYLYHCVKKEDFND